VGCGRFSVSLGSRQLKAGPHLLVGGNPSGRVRKPFKCLPTHFHELINASQSPTPLNSRTLLLVSPSAHDQSTEVDSLQYRPNPSPLQDRVHHASSSYRECQGRFEHRHQPIARQRVCHLVPALFSGPTTTIVVSVDSTTLHPFRRTAYLLVYRHLLRHLKTPQHVGFKVRQPSSLNSM